MDDFEKIREKAFQDISYCEVAHSGFDVKPWLSMGVFFKSSVEGGKIKWNKRDDLLNHDDFTMVEALETFVSEKQHQVYPSISTYISTWKNLLLLVKEPDDQT